MAKLTRRQTGTQKRLYEQLDFFGAKKKRYVSIYAKKPRIRVKHKEHPNFKLTVDSNEAERKLIEKQAKRRERLAGIGFGVPIGAASGFLAGIVLILSRAQRAQQAQRQAQETAMNYQRQQFELGQRDMRSVLSPHQSQLSTLGRQSTFGGVEPTPSVATLFAMGIY